MESLPEELIVEIFSYIHSNEINKLTLVCKRFNDIISRTPILLEKVQIVSDVWRKKEDPLPLRKYRKVKVRDVNNKFAIKLIEHIGESIHEMSIGIEEFNVRNFKKLLNFCPNLRHLKLDKLDIALTDDEFCEPYPKLQLDTLDLCHDETVLSSLSECSVKSMKVKIYEDDLNDFTNLIKMLKRQKHLENLELYSYTHSVFNLFDEDSLIDVDFKLKKLFLQFKFFMVNSVNFIKFLQNQTSIQEVTVTSSLLSHYTQMMNAMAEIPHIKKTTIKNNKIQFQPMPHVETLTLDEVAKIPIDFHEKFPNLTNLCLKDCYNLKFSENVPDEIKCFVNFFHIPINVKTLTLEHATFQDDSPFDDVDIKIDDLTVVGCENIDWLIRHIEIGEIRLKSLKIENSKMTKGQRQYFEGLCRPEGNFKIPNVEICMPMKCDVDGDCIVDYDIDN